MSVCASTMGGKEISKTSDLHNAGLDLAHS